MKIMKMTVRSAFVLALLGRAASSAPLPMSGSAPQSGSAASAPSSVAESAAKADALLNEAEVWVVELEKTVKGGPDGSGCPPNFSMRSYLRDKKEKRGEKELGANIPDAGDNGNVEWEFSLVCQALAARSPAPCAEAADLLRNEEGRGPGYYSKGSAASDGWSADYATQKDKCVASYRVMRAKIAYVARDPNFMTACRESAPYIPPAKSPAALDATCAAWQSSSRDTGPLASAIANGMKTPLKPEYAREAAREMISDPALCPAENKDDASLGCIEINDYRAALARKDAGACRGGLCRMLMGGGAAACEPYALKLKKHVCSNFYRSRYSAERTPVVEERLKLAETLITSVSSRVSNLREAQAFTDRLDRVYALRDRLARAVAVLGKLNKGADKSPAKGAGSKQK